MSEWKEYKLNDLITKLGDGLHGTPNYDPNGAFYFINGSNLKDGKITVNENTKKVGKEEYNKYKKELTDRTIFVSINGTLGNIATYNNESVILGKSACYFNVKEEVSKDFIKYVVTNNAFQHYINEYATGTTIKNVPLKAIREYPIRLPELRTQNLISEILSFLDDKIELNNKINQELESLAQLLFKRWFVDFEFPYKNGEPYKSSGGEMADSELGETPKNWNILNLELITSEITRGFTTSYVEKSKIINLNQKVNRGNYLDKSNYKFYSDDTIVPENKFAKYQDILINSLGQGTLGRIHFYLENTDNIVVDQHITIVRAKESIIKSEILYLSLILESNIDRMSNMVTGSTGMLMLNISKIREFKILVPPLNIQESIVKTLQSLFEKISSNTRENEELVKLRDTLLPKLISGELQINDN